VGCLGLGNTIWANSGRYGSFMPERRVSDPGEAEYMFGDDSTASDRLRLLARIFAESSRSFVNEAVPDPPNLAVDIGCGPGYTTRLIARTLKPRLTVGMDTSEVYVAQAQRTARGSERYLVHDATAVPFPIGPADVLYARFVATHLRDPEAVIGAWGSQLVRGGVLLLDEVESITTSNRVLSRYLEVVNSLLNHEGRTLYIGPVLDTIRLPEFLQTRANGVRSLPVLDRRAAEMFRLNMEAWRHRRFATDTYGADAIRRLAYELDVMARGSSPKSTIEWEMRQIAFERS